MEKASAICRGFLLYGLLFGLAKKLFLYAMAKLHAPSGVQMYGALSNADKHHKVA